MSGIETGSSWPKNCASKRAHSSLNCSMVNVLPELNPMSSASFAAAMQSGQNQSPWGSSSNGGDRQYMWYLRGGGEVVLAKKRHGKKEVSGWRGGSPR